jgi:uncharacterized YigZ family protein
MPAFSYRTIQAAARGMYKEKGSKFLAFAYPVTTDAEIKDVMAALKKEYFDARHHCFAWVLGADKKSFRTFDDGEPNHSAGDPIFGQIRAKDLTNILVVVVRYFGGTKLGVGGLISAYKQAAEDAISQAVVIEMQVSVQMKLSYHYNATPEIMRLVKAFELTIIEQRFEEDCILTVEFDLIHKELILDKIKLLKAMGVEVNIIE